MNDEKKEEKKKRPERVNFKVYNMPIELLDKYISMAKLHYDNEVWRVLEHAMKLLMGETVSWKESVEKRLDMIGKRLDSLEDNEEEDVKTFGGE